MAEIVRSGVPSESSPIEDFIDWLLEMSPWELREQDLDEGRIGALCFPSKGDLIAAYADYVIKHA